MRNARAILVAALALVVAAIAAAATIGPGASRASSHREAPLISEDPSADLTDLYAFRSPDKPNTVTLLANVLPGEDPAAGPNWYTFSPGARYNIKVDTDGDVKPNVIYRFQFQTKTGPYFLGDTAQPFTVTRVEGGKTTVVAKGTTAPNNIGPRSTPDYHALATKSIASFDGGASKAFAGQRDDPFFGDVGAIFDLVAIRKGTGNAGGGKDFFSGYGVHTYGIQVPIADLHAKNGTIGVWASVERRQLTTRGQKTRDRGNWVQVDRLGEPARERGHHPDGPEGHLERAAAVERGRLQEVLRVAHPRGRDQQAVQARCPRNGPRRPRRGAPHRRAEAQLHGAEAGRRAPSQPRHPRRRPAEPDGRARR